MRMFHNVCDDYTNCQSTNIICRPSEKFRETILQRGHLIFKLSPTHLTQSCSIVKVTETSSRLINFHLCSIKADPTSNGTEQSLKMPFFCKYFMTINK